jgi:predicted AlkP superfamily phosphohydrolase/phosphomutase
MFTSTQPAEHGVTGFVVGGITANTHMLKQEPFWSVLSKLGVTVGMANVPATFPVLPVDGYMISGMLTRGKNCEDGILCAPKLSEVEGGDAVYPPAMKAELIKNVGDFYIDCERMPSAADLSGHEIEVIDAWLKKVQLIRDQQTQLFDYLLTNHPTDFTWLVQSCEDRTGHWLYPIAPYNVGYNPKVNGVRTDAFPNQYIAFDKVLTKKLCIEAGVPTAKFFLVDSESQPLPKHLKLPLVVKPVRQGSSVGMDTASIRVSDPGRRRHRSQLWKVSQSDLGKGNGPSRGGGTP